jgi:carbon storage regulator
MLILTRKVDQGIVIQGNILVKVLGVERDRVKIGIAAPGEIAVLRQELIDRGRDGNPGDRPRESAGPGAKPSSSPV